MPTTRSITLYSFSELSEQAKEKAIDKLQNINVEDDWWDPIYECAESIGLKIEEFDLYRRDIKGCLTEYFLDVSRFIRQKHGKQCETFKIAADFHKDYIAAFVKWREAQVQMSDPSAYHLKDWKPKDWLEEFIDEEEAEKIEEEFRKALLEEYRFELDREYDRLTGREAIVETIEANDFLFTENGRIELFTWDLQP